MSKTPVVTVSQGQLQGRVVDSPSGKPFCSFQGIPYAKPPLGLLRFKAPQPPEPWEGVRDATSEGNISAQVDFIFGMVYAGEEDCLFLNVYTPNLDGSLPVMFWIHGGGFRWGSGNSNLYGPDYLVEKDVVVVTINYRCGPLGFLCLNTPEVPGNAGLKDQIQALRWVKENIHKFGGNPDNITIFGESAGGVSTSILTASPLSKNLISKAIMESGIGLCSWGFQDDPIGSAKRFAKYLGCKTEDVDKILEFLNSIPAKDLIEAYEKLDPILGKMTGKPHLFMCVIEKEFPGVEAVLSEAFIDILTSGRVANVPIMLGYTALEIAFSMDPTADLQLHIPSDLNIEKDTPDSLAIAEQLQKIYLQGQPLGPENMMELCHLLSDVFVNIDAYRYVKCLVQSTNNPVYFYRFDYVGELNLTKAMSSGAFGNEYAAHMDELAYLFKNDFQKDVKPTPQDLVTRERLVRLWTNFAKYGNPTPKNDDYLTTTWLPATKETIHYLNIGSELSLLANPNKERMDFWEDLYSKYFQPRTRKTMTEASRRTNETGRIRTSNEIKMQQNLNVVPKVVVRANDPQEDDLPKNVGVNKFVNFYESLSP